MGLNKIATLILVILLVIGPLINSSTSFSEKSINAFSKNDKIEIDKKNFKDTQFDLRSIHEDLETNFQSNWHPNDKNHNKILDGIEHYDSFKNIQSGKTYELFVKLEGSIEQLEKKLSSIEAKIIKTWKYTDDWVLIQILGINFESLLAIPEVIVVDSNELFMGQARMDSARYYTGINQLHELGFGGDGVVIAIPDSGIDANHVDLDEGKVIGWKDLVNNQPEPYDDFGHGSLIAGIISGTGEGNSSLIGVAPNSSLVIVKVLNQDGWSSVDRLMDSIDWIIDTKDTYGTDIISISFGTLHWGEQTALTDKVDEAVDAGLTVVVSAGNSGFNGIDDPGNSKKAITVGNLIDPSDNGWDIYYSSSLGPINDGTIKPDITAPGTNIRSVKTGTTDQYESGTGTSFSTPFVAGVIAQYLSSAGLTAGHDPKIIKQLVENTAIDMGNLGKDNVYGYGRINATALLMTNIHSQTLHESGQEDWWRIQTYNNNPLTITINGSFGNLPNLDLEIFSNNALITPLSFSRGYTNTEQVTINNPGKNYYWVKVKGTTILSSPVSYLITSENAMEMNLAVDNKSAYESTNIMGGAFQIDSLTENGEASGILRTMQDNSMRLSSKTTSYWDVISPKGGTVNVHLKVPFTVMVSRDYSLFSCWNFKGKIFDDDENEVFTQLSFSNWVESPNSNSEVKTVSFGDNGYTVETYDFVGCLTNFISGISLSSSDSYIFHMIIKLESNGATPYSNVDFIDFFSENNQYGLTLLSMGIASYNQAPETPSTPTGPSSGYTNQGYQFTFSGTDIDNDLLTYEINWGDGSATFIGPFASGDTFSLFNTYYSTGTKYIKVRSTDPMGHTSNWSSTKSITISSSGGGGGGGGCVSKNTLIYLPDGTFVKAKELKIGEMIQSFDLDSNILISVVVVRIDVSVVSTLLVINDKLLELTPEHQPIYMKNSTFVGFENNPHNLKIGDFLFNPIEDKWIQINSLEYKYGNFKVYDIHTTNNAFIGNGILLDPKQM